MRKLTSTVIITGTGVLPSFIAGLNLYFLTASIAFSSSPMPSARTTRGFCGFAVRIHNQRDQANALILGPARLVGELRFQLYSEPLAPKLRRPRDKVRRRHFRQSLAHIHFRFPTQPTA